MELYAIEKNYVISYLEAIENATTEERSAALAVFGDKPIDSIVAHSDNGNEAMITISGPLSPSGPSPLARFFGYSGTGYNDIVAAAKKLENDPAVDTVRLVMNTPGGTVSGMDQARQALESLASKKNVIAENHGMIASAGYYLATAAHKITATSPLVETGSIGVIRAGFDYSDAMSRNGIKRIKIVSSNAPNKQADPTTAQGLKVHQDEVDATERVFIQKISEGRNTTAEHIIENYGKGGILIAQDPDKDKPSALKSGMIDSVYSFSVERFIDTGESGDTDATNEINNDLETATAAGGQQPKGIVMDLVTLKAEHPALYAQAVAIGVDQGVTTERDRASAHIEMGEACKNMDLAVSCIKDGAEFSPMINAKYMAASINGAAVADRSSEGEPVIETKETTQATHDQEVADALALELGVETNA